MEKVASLKQQLRDLRKLHCPPVSKMKKADIVKEIERLKDQRPTEYKAEEKERKPKAKKEMKEMAVQADVEEYEKEKKAAKKIKAVLKKNVEKKKEKREQEQMAAEDKKEAKPKKERYSGYYLRPTESTSQRGTAVTSSILRRVYKVTYKGKGKYDVELAYIHSEGQMGKSYTGPPKRKQIYNDVKVGMYRGQLTVFYDEGKYFTISKPSAPITKGPLSEGNPDYDFYQEAVKYAQEHE